MTILHIPVWAWAATIAALVLLLGADFGVSARRRKPERLTEAALWTLATVVAALGFGALLAVTVSGTAAGQFYAGWLTEYSLSLDNLFVFAVLIGASAVPRQLHGRVLLAGILLALVLRGAVIGLGAAALHQFGWVEYLFGAFLLYTAYRLVRQRGGGQRSTRADGPMRAARRLLPVSPQADGARLITRVGGRWRVTPVLVLIIALGATDVLFAVDSIPAIFGLTRDPFLVFTANLFALLGLRHLYFIVGGLIGRLAHLSAGLAGVLAFIGLKIVSEALRNSGVHQLGPVPVPAVSAGISLAVIGGLITITVLTSLAAQRRRAAPLAGQPPGSPAPPGPPAPPGSPALPDTPARPGSPALPDTPAGQASPARPDDPAQPGGAAMPDSPAGPRGQAQPGGAGAC
jgi:tellurite resistance protein TerC